MIVAHADWSVDARKRWVARAQRDQRGNWTALAPCPVGEPSTFLARLLAEADGAPVALGVDLPLGVPRAWAPHAGARDFPAFLRGLNGTRAEEFFAVAATLDQVSPARPFYPARGQAGMTRLAHARALGFAEARDLSRLCDRATPERPAGAPLFWTLGANQSGKAAVAAWRDMIVPALAENFPLRLWPFEGELAALLAPGTVTIAETYPAECLRHLGARVAGSKRALNGRASAMPSLRAWAHANGVRPAPAMDAAMDANFGGDPAGEDRFDCTVGLFGVLNLLLGRRADHIPDDPMIRTWEGWVLGQQRYDGNVVMKRARTSGAGTMQVSVRPNQRYRLRATRS
jgi:hypothetical protein